MNTRVASSTRRTSIPVERLEEFLGRYREIVRPLPKSLATFGGNQDGIAPGAGRPVARFRRRLKNKNHILAQSDRELARAARMRGDNRPVIASAATVHGELTGSSRSRTGFRRGSFRQACGKLG